MKRILVIGSGGREHAIVWALRNTSPVPVELFCAPGNAGIGQLAQLVNVSVNDHEALAEFAEANQVELTFVGPEAPLTAGIVDAFDASGLPVVGPTAAAARLEGSKIFAKD
ncbi:MAG TPA: phosphoribosylamine--glycine ligase N-terminal domain-containing protein, partial [Pyrinomonadaceae bacterium]|nr:phosphoribosylamine--glycine ligase N-terminal domain-containing protein [Pyrinomonadaceae bacterium]